MKKIILSVFAIAAMQAVQAQNKPAATEAPAAQQNTPPSPEMMAKRQAHHLQKVLTLSEEQKEKVYQATLTRTSAMQQLKANGEKHGVEAKAVKEQYVKNVNAVLSPEQQQKWEQYRLQQKQRHADNKNRQHGAAPAANGAPPANNPPPVKLESQDYGINDN